MDFFKASAPLLQSKRHQRYVAGSLNRQSQLSLMMGTITGYTPGKDLSSFRGIAPQASGVLIINKLDVVYTKTADPLARSALITFRHIYTIGSALRTGRLCPLSLKPIRKN